MIAELLIGSTLLLGGYSFYKYENKHIEKALYTIESEKIPKDFDDFKIVQISDLHNATFGASNYRLLEVIDDLEPDIVVITGDLVDGENNNYKVALDLVNTLCDKYDVYYIVGNHEQKALLKRYKDKYKEYFNKLNKTKIINLNNECIELKRKDSSINLYGIVIPFECYKYFFNNKNKEKINIDEIYLKDNLGSINKNKYNILLSHTPFYFEEYVKWGVDLVLSGHVHGGIIRIPFLGGLLSPNREFFPKYDLGKYDDNESSMILTKGLGGSKIIPRFNCKPEVVRVELKSKKTL